jgi:hypothetical protein
LARVLWSDGLGQAQLHLQGHQLLLGAIVDVALDPAALGVLGLDQPDPGGLEVFDQPDVSKDQPGLGGQVPGELILGRGQALPRGLGDGKGSQLLALVGHGDEQVRVLGPSR